MVDNAGMFNYTTGKWNPSTDAFVYSGKNSITGEDLVGLYAGARIFGKGADLPAWLKPIDKTVKLGKKINEKRGDINWKLDRALRKSVYPRRDLKGKKNKLKEDLKTIARFARSKKGKVATGTAIATALQTGSQPQNNRGKTDTEISDWIHSNRRREKKRAWVIKA
jgi:hypothetical protein